MISGPFREFWQDSQLVKMWFIEANPETFQLPFMAMILLTYFRGERGDKSDICFRRDAPPTSLFLVFYSIFEKKTK